MIGHGLGPGAGFVFGHLVLNAFERKAIAIRDRNAKTNEIQDMPIAGGK